MPDDDIALRARKGMEAFSRGDLDDALEAFSEDIMWEVGRDLAPDAGLYHGHEGVRRFWAQWRDLFEEFRLEIIECRAIDEERALAVTRSHGVGAGSGISVTSPAFVQLFEFRGDKIVRVRLATSREAALRDG